MGINDEGSLDGRFELKWDKGSNFASLFLKAPLDYEEKQFYRIEVFAKDQGRNESEEVKKTSTAVFIDVKDEDDQMPVFTKVCSISNIEEMKNIGHEVFEVKAVDGDFGINNEIRYSIVEVSSGMDKDYFRIGEKNGSTTINKQIDREDPNLNLVDDPMLIISIEASEWNGSNYVSNRTTKINCNIIIEDINDNLPKFSNTQYSATVRENTQANIPVEFTDEPKVTDLDM
ncbi:cadherin-related hmr-1-like, partial [Limulus polyphemus]|uniref:Cadherin-related hmr-1-like n=1 Tax=Limulus polyphemus TaxID=6850 RepID=A0ABM1TLB8_LIMPO